MRFILPLACALAASAAAWFGFSGATGESSPPVSVQPVSVTAVEDAQMFLREAAAGMTRWVCVEVGSSSFSIRYGDKSAEIAGCDKAPLTYILCDRANANSAVGEPSTLTCNNCHLMMPDGTTAEAPEALFDSESGKLTLRGSDIEPVKVTMAGGGTISTLTAPSLEIEIKHSLDGARVVSAPTPLAANF